METVEIIVIGAGVVGLAVARELALSRREVIVLERHAAIGTEVSSRNSEVIHGGLYYPTSSLKAELCVSGRQLLTEFCRSRDVPFRSCGKLIVANGEAEERRLRAILEQAQRNGVPVEWLTGQQASALEPAVRCTAAVHSPTTGIVDSHALMTTLHGDFENATGQVALGSTFLGATASSSGFTLTVSAAAEQSQLACKWLINCGGLSAVDNARRIRGLAPQYVPGSHLAKGHYFSLSGKTPFGRLIYPIPNEAGLGIHATLDLAGSVKFGPDVEWVHSLDYEVDATRAPSFYASVRTYWPGLRDGALQPAYAGIRPKIVGPGAAAADFVIQAAQVHGVPGLVNLFGIESPGLTASLAIAERVRRILGSV